MNIIVIIAIIIGHWVGDYIFQSPVNILGKGNNTRRVFEHAAQYTTVTTAFVSILILFGVIPTLSWYFIINFWIFTFVFHFVVDYLTSSLVNGIGKENMRFGYFSIIITDQMIHLTLLFLTLNYLFY